MRHQSVGDHQRPAVIVLTFQLAMRNAGNFSLFLCGLLGAVLNSPLVEYSKLLAPKEAGRLWQVSTLLAGGCPVFVGSGQ